jgi:hypothetical protein
MSNVDVSDPEIGRAYKDIMSGSQGETAWMLLRYADAKNIELDTVGRDGLLGLLAQLTDEAVQYAYLVVNLNPGVKYLLLTWVGPAASPMARSRVAVHKGSVKSRLPGFTVEYQANNREDLEPATIAKKTVLPLMSILPASAGTAVNEGPDHDTYKCFSPGSAVRMDFDSTRFGVHIVLAFEEAHAGSTLIVRAKRRVDLDSFLQSLGGSQWQVAHIHVLSK